MQRIITNEELSVYLSKLQNQSKDFKKFLYQYVTGDLWIRSRGEEDINIWKRLEGDELEVAKNIIISELKSHQTFHIFVQLVILGIQRQFLY